MLFFEVEGKISLVSNLLNPFFIINVSNTRLSKIDRINTWLTCLYGCPNANGSNNIKRVPTEDFKFWVILHRDQALTDWTLQQIQGAQFKIHYEVEGPCAENGI